MRTFTFLATVFAGAGLWLFGLPQHGLIPATGIDTGLGFAIDRDFMLGLTVGFLGCLLIACTLRGLKANFVVATFLVALTSVAWAAGMWCAGADVEEAVGVALGTSLSFLIGAMILANSSGR